MFCFDGVSETYSYNPPLILVDMAFLKYNQLTPFISVYRVFDKKFLCCFMQGLPTSPHAKQKFEFSGRMLLFKAVFACLFCICSCNPHAKKLYDDLLHNYNRLIRSVGLLVESESLVRYEFLAVCLTLSRGGCTFSYGAQNMLI